MEWEVDIAEDFNSQRVAVRIFAETAPGVYQVMCPMVQEGKITWGMVTVQEGEMLPSMWEFSAPSVRRGVLDKLMRALTAFGASIKEEPNTLVVDAMRVHLSDLQSLIFGSDDLRLVRGRKTDADI